MKRTLLLVVVLAALVSASVATSAPGLKLDKKDISSKQCKTDGAKQVVNVHFTIINDSDSGFNSGLAWSNDTIDRQLRIWRHDDGTFCAVRIYKAGRHGTWLNQDDVAAADSGDIT